MSHDTNPNSPQDDITRLRAERDYAADGCDLPEALSEWINDYEIECIHGLQAAEAQRDALAKALEEAHAAILRAEALAADGAEGWLEEAQQANAEGDKAAEAEWMRRANSFTAISNAMQPALGVALRARRASEALARTTGGGDHSPVEPLQTRDAAGSGKP